MGPAPGFLSAGRGCLQITTLGLGVQRIEHERGLARAGPAHHHRQSRRRQIEVDSHKIVLPSAANPNHAPTYLDGSDNPCVFCLARPPHGVRVVKRPGMNREDPMDAPPPSVLPQTRAMSLPLIMLLAMVFSRALFECGGAVGFLGLALVSGTPLETLGTDPTAIIRTDLMALLSMSMQVSMVVLLVLCWMFFGPENEPRLFRRMPGPLLALLGVLSGSTVGFVSGWLHEQLSHLLPELAQLAMQAQIVDALTTGPWFGRGLMLFAVIIIAPLFEELAFRGVLWRGFETAGRAIRPENALVGRRIAFVATTLLFAVWHVDPLHVLALMPTATLLGWLRYCSGSIWPSVLAHFVNNTMAAVIPMVVDMSDPAPTPLWLVSLGAIATTGLATAAWLVRPREDS